MRLPTLTLCVGCLFLLNGVGANGQSNSRGALPQWPGRQPDGSVLLPNQWSLRPVGRQIGLGDFPVNVALHPRKSFVAVLNAGYGRHEVMIVDLESEQVVSRAAIEEGFYGITFSLDGRFLFCSGAGDEVIHRFAVEAGKLSKHEVMRLRDASIRGVPSGVAASRNGADLYVANLWGQSVTKVDLKKGTVAFELVLANHMTNTSGHLPAPSPDWDLAAAEKRALALLDTAGADEPFPYACALDEGRQRLYVSLWAQAAVAVIDLKSRQVIARWSTEEHPNEMALTKSGKRLFVANANRNTVTVLDTERGKPVEVLSAALYPSAPPGSTPNSLALTPDEKRLFVANADNNNVAVFDLSTPGKSRSLGFIPVGWYPTSVRVTQDGKRLLVANGKGTTSKANPLGPQPGKDPPANIREYIGGLFRGTLSIIDLPGRAGFDEQLRAYTGQAYRCSPLNTNSQVGAGRPERSPIPSTLSDSTPIRYCIYIIKENRTYDQVFGDMAEANGDPKLCLFPGRVTPNHHKLAREFVLLDNFYVESEVSADGHEWTMGAYATDFVEKSWPLSYGHNKMHGKYPYPSEGRFKVAAPAGGYLWDRAREAGVSYRSYGEFVNNGKTSDEPCTTRLKALAEHFDPWFRSFDLDYSDLKRAERFIAELKRFETEGEMPRLQVVRLPNDHTAGTAAGKPTPTAYVAENDLAFGRVVEAISRSKFWPRTAIFVVEDDAQNGPDHVDAHRTIAFVISPYTRRRAVDSTMYSTSSMLRTVELILGLKPMSQFDAAATPMYNSFQTDPDLRFYEAVPANVALDERNSVAAWGSGISKHMDLAKEDAADDLLLNEVIWRSVRGPNNPMPAPVRAAFVFTRSDGDDD